MNSSLESGFWVYNTTNLGKLKHIATELARINFFISDCKKFKLMLEYVNFSPVENTKEINLDKIRMKRANIDLLYTGNSILDTRS